MPAPAIEIARCSSLRMAASACIQQERAQVLTHLAQNVRFLLTPWVFKCITCISQNKALLHCLQFCTFNGELYMVKHGIARSCKPGGGFDTHTHIHTHTHTQTDFQTSWLLWCLLWMFWTRLHVSWCGYLHHVLHTHTKNCQAASKLGTDVCKVFGPPICPFSVIFLNLWFSFWRQ